MSSKKKTIVKEDESNDDILIKSNQKNIINKKAELKKEIKAFEKEKKEFKKEKEAFEKEKVEFRKNNSKERKIFDKESPLGILQKLADEKYLCENDKCSWKGSPLESLDKLKSDCSGKVGEMFIDTLCKKGEMPCIYNGDINSLDGTYDIQINSKKVEIKTAKLGKQKGFQHDSLRSDGYDYIMFVDVTPNDLYISISCRFDLRNKSELFGRKAHLRKGTNDVFKFDLNEKILESIISKGCTIKVTENTTLSDITSFFTVNIK